MRNALKRFKNYILNFLNKFKLKTKLMFLFVVCVILPLVIVDSVLLGLVFKAEYDNTEHEMQTVAESVRIEISDTISQAEMMTNRFYINSDMNNYLETDYETTIDYYEAYHKKSNGIMKLANSNDLEFCFYSDNPTIIPGGSFASISSVENSEWYKRMVEEDREGMVLFYYEADKFIYQNPKRLLSYVRKYNYFQPSKYTKYIKCNIDYNAIVRNLTNNNYLYPVYICQGDTILYSNVGYSTITAPFEKLTGNEKIAYRKDFSVDSLELTILVLRPRNYLLGAIKHAAPMALPILLFSLLIPFFLMSLINKSLVDRLYILSDYFSNTDIDHMKKIENVEGSDEISTLMNDYNRMVDRSNDLIQNAYKSRIEKQEGDILKQKAELLALQSQINPHFLFNSLESIRMHSVIKNEQETADVLERLATLVRKNVDWTDDDALVLDEVKFIEDYLAIQKYRFGDRLKYDVNVEEECKNYYIPRLSLVTFVENACVHGMEGKAGVCNVDIEIYEEDGMLCLETEDTGMGMNEEDVRLIKENMNNSSIDMIMNSRHVGILNACVRLKMISDNKATFEIESEKGLGTYILIKIPTDKLKKA